MREFVRPSALPAVTKSSEPRRRISARTRRNTSVQRVRPMTIITLKIDGRGMIDMTEMMRKKAGKQVTTSLKRERTMSTQPLK
jgi:hypothetical protein